SVSPASTSPHSVLNPVCARAPPTWAAGGRYLCLYVCQATTGHRTIKDGYHRPKHNSREKLYNLARQKQHELRTLMESQQREKVRCEAKDDKAELGIQKALDAALSRVRQRSSEIPRESEATAGGLSDAGPALPSFEIEPRRGDGMSLPPVLT